MVQARYIKLVLLCGLFWSSALASNCPYKECDCDTASILCQNKGLTSLPESFGTEIARLHYLFLDANQITDLPESSLPASLIELSLFENPISTVEIAAFDDSAHSLKTLSFSKAHFTKIPNALLHLNVLKEFTIYETNIIDWNINAIQHIGQTLTALRISRFGLGTWPDWIQYLPLLTELTIISSSISTIPDNAFDGLANSLKQLTLDNNSLTAVPKALSKLTSIEMLSLRDNKIVDISLLPLSNSLISLNLNYNPISQISSSAFTNLKALIDLYMQGTRLTRLPLALTSLIKLNVLDVRNSSDLVCTCSESSLADWFLLMNPSDVSGNCGATTVYDFFVSISVTCPV